MKSTTQGPKAIGELRQSQVVSTFGPGAMVDLPDQSVLVSGLEYWRGDRKRVYEERLEARVAELLGHRTLALYAPPVDEEDPRAARTGIPTFAFPSWFLAQVDRKTRDRRGNEVRTRPLVHVSKLRGGKEYVDDERKAHDVVPVGFVQACPNGHLSDIDWYTFVHGGPDACRGQLWLDEGGSGSDLAEVFVRCEACHKRRVLGAAQLAHSRALGECRGERPWLGPRSSEDCTSASNGKPEANRLLVRSASHAYFPEVLSVISIPDKDRAIRDAVDKVYEDFLQYAEDEGDVTRDRRKQKVAVALTGLSDAAVWEEVRRRKQGLKPLTKSLKQVEVETLLAVTEHSIDAPSDKDFHAGARSLAGLPAWLVDRVERIVLVHRLREVRAQVGFTRFEPNVPDFEGELSLGVKRAALALEPEWVPAVENRGEGVFLAFRKDAIASWLGREAVARRGRKLEAGFERWMAAKQIDRATFPGLPYILLHSLSHLLITAVSLEAGYSASSIRERVYAGESGYGILLYTGASGTEGTLGGLVQVGRHIEEHLERALDEAALCSNDPVCAQHAPEDQYEERFLHGAACHGCLLIAETSCERRNEYLDRALVVPTVAEADAAFFPEVR